MKYTSYIVEAYSFYRNSPNWKQDFKEAIKNYRPKISCKAWKAHKIGLKYALKEARQFND